MQYLFPSLFNSHYKMIACYVHQFKLLSNRSPPPCLYFFVLHVVVIIICNVSLGCC